MSTQAQSDDNTEYYDLGDFHRTISTRSPEAQLWFDRGLIWSYGFNHEEAAKCFEKAIAHDPTCAMGYWGLAYSLGPTYNRPWHLFSQKERLQVADKTHRAVEDAFKRCSSATPPVEKALIKALRQRYPGGQPTRANCSRWNRTYADAMEKVVSRFSDDMDVVALYADALVNLKPWQQWDLKTGEPTKGARTLETKRALEEAMATEAGHNHPALLHLYIHLMEISKQPEVALPAADRLRLLVPDAGHLNHMPSHIDILIGDYAQAVVANSEAIRADDKYLSREGPLNFYTLYRCHDYHFRIYAAMFSAQSRVAFDTIAQLEATISEELLRVETPPMADWLESFLSMRIHAMIRFGHWRDIIALELPRDQDLYCVTTALTLYARGMAYAALGRVSDAEHQQQLFRKAVPRVRPSRTLFNNKCVDILGIAALLFDGEVEYRRGNYGAAFATLRDSIARYDALPYDEPWGWMQPARHAYGALLLEQGHVPEALGVYAADLGIDETLARAQRHPNNVWALHGYHECLVRLGRMNEARRIKPQLDAALAVADVPITSSCFCRRTCAATAKI